MRRRNLGHKEDCVVLFTKALTLPTYRYRVLITNVSKLRHLFSPLFYSDVIGIITPVMHFEVLDQLWDPFSIR
jgi:hypothetical protein